MSYRFLDDLIPIVIESNNHWWPADLANLCRVSASWLYVARTRLYQHPHLTTHRACSLLARSLNEKPSLRSLIKGICLQLVPCYPNTKPAAYAENLRTLLGIDGLESLTLGEELAIAAGRFLHMVATPGTVTELRIHGGTMSSAICRSPSLEWDETLALKFSNLQSLHLSNLMLEIDMSVEMLPWSSMIRTLVLENVDIADGRLLALIPENTILEHLHFTTEDASIYEDGIREILVSREVHSLEYKVRNRYYGEVRLFQREMGRLPHLKRLRVEGIYVDRDTMDCIREVCTGLRELEVEQWEEDNNSTATL